MNKTLASKVADGGKAVTLSVDFDIESGRARFNVLTVGIVEPERGRTMFHYADFSKAAKRYSIFRDMI